MPSLYTREKSPTTGTWQFRKVKEGRGVKTGDLQGRFMLAHLLTADNDGNVWLQRRLPRPNAKPRSFPTNSRPRLLV